jgi:hypothetical protein
MLAVLAAAAAVHMPVHALERGSVRPGRFSRSLMATTSTAQSLKLTDVKSSYGISFGDLVVPVQTTEDLQAEIRRGAQQTFLGLMPGVTVAPCSPLELPSGSYLMLDCAGNTIDLRCINASLKLGPSAQLALIQCHVLWPTDRPFLSQPGSDFVIGDDAQVTILRGSSSFYCPVRIPPAFGLAQQNRFRGHFAADDLLMIT